MSSARIAFLCPNMEIGERAMHLAKELGMEKSVSIADGRLPSILEHAKKLEAEGVDVLVARGTSAETILRSSIRTPVVEIPVSGEDLAKVLRDAKLLTDLPHPRIALLAFTSIQRDLEFIANLLGINLTIYGVLGDLRYMKEQVIKAKANGVDVIVGGSVSSQIARECGLLAVPLYSGDVSVRTALLEARKVAYARKLEKTQNQRFRAVVESSRNGILVVDDQGTVLVNNQAARSFLRLAQPMEGESIAEVLPSIDLRACLSSGTPIVDELIPHGDATLLCNAMSTRVDDRVSGAVIELQPSGTITALETKIRKSLLGMGMSSRYRFADIWAQSSEMKATIAEAHLYASTACPVLICGETGTGKELLAQAIHNESSYRRGLFVPVNCAALPPTLLESELFGYEEGAFTGAKRKGKPGMFEMAQGGSIFLDEIAEMDHYGQTRLLRVLQELSVMRLGGDKYIPVDMRVIAATNRDLREEVRAGRFREDLFFRLNILRLSVPPLRDRQGDIPYLASCFAEVCHKKYGRAIQLTPRVLACLQGHNWPGNVRELSAAIERLALLSTHNPPTLAEVEKAMDVKAVPPPLTASQSFSGGRDSEQSRILDALRQSNYNLQNAASLLHIHRSTLHRKMRHYGIRRIAGV